MAAMKSMMCYVVDSGSTMKNNIFNNSTVNIKDSKFVLAQTLILTHITQKIMTSKTAEFSVITYGDSQTVNYLNQTQGGYENVKEVVEMGKPNIFTLKQLAKVTKGHLSSEQPSDLVNGIIVGQDILMRYNAKYKYNRIMIIITDGETQVDELGISDLEQVLTQMKTIENCILYSVLLGKSSHATSSFIKKENAKLLQTCTEATGGYYLEADTLSELLRLLSSGVGFSTRSQLTKSVLEISPNLRIPCVTFGQVMKAKVPTLKKQVKSSSIATSGAVEDDEDGDGISAVKRITEYKNPNNDDIPFEERVKGYRYGSQYIPLDEVEEASLKLESSSVVRIIGFLQATRVPRHHLLTPTVILQGVSSNASSSTSIACISRTLHELNQVAIARYVKKENSDPVLVALIPHVVNDGSLLLFRLPCIEDIREYSYPSLQEYGDKSTIIGKRKLVNDFVDKFTVKEIETSQLVPVNPCLYSSIEFIRDNVIGNEVSKEVLVPLENPLRSIFELNQHEGVGVDSAEVGISNKAVTNGEIDAKLDLLKSSFNLSKVLQVKERKKTFWSDIQINSDNNAGDADVDYRITVTAIPNNTDAHSMTAETSGKNDNNTNSIINDLVSKLPVFSIGSVRPVEEFQQVLTYLSNIDTSVESTAENSLRLKVKELSKNAMSTLIQIIDNLVTKGMTNSHFRKAISCIKTLRKSCIVDSESQYFNDYMMNTVKLKYKESPLYRSFWYDFIVQEKILPVSTNEDVNSSISLVQAESFLKDIEASQDTNVISSIVISNEDEDLFDDMA